MLSTVKSFEILAKFSEYGFISEIVALNWYIFTPLTYKKLLLQSQCRLQNYDSVKLIEYLTSAVIVLLCNPSVGPSPRTKIYFFLWSVSVDELFSTAKIITFLPKSKFESKKIERESNPIP